MPRRWAGRNVLFLTIIIIIYMATGMAYAWLTPPWETPDEPAHFNYVRHLVYNRGLPILEQDDYDYEYLERIKAAQFPPDMSIDPIRYEFHQPPLYYFLGATIVTPLPETWWLMVLRMLSVALGCVLLIVVYLIGTEIFPQQPIWALGAVAFVATVPMHTAMTAAINNDTLAEVILGLVLLSLVHRTIDQAASYVKRDDIALGLLIGLGLLTKTTTYIAIPLALVVIVAPSIWGYFQNPDLKDRTLPWAQTIRSMLRVFGVALALGAIWFVRNSLVYGGTDILGMGRHNAIMLEQPHTAEWLARLGWSGLAKAFLLTTFRSFWAQFGWMGILVDERIYLVLCLLSLLAALGFVLFLARDFGKLLTQQKLALGILFLSFVLTLASYIWYNTQFVQHQGRYLFPALIPLGIGFALGIWTVLNRVYAKYFAGLFVLAALAVAMRGWLAGHINKWFTALLSGTAILFGIRRLLPQTWRKGLYVLPFLGLWAIDMICLLGFIVPHFRS